ncbi:lipocalin family protein [Flavobacterium sp. DG1-102-2]|uniref:lipocalin family protein n=1 Tax=Flavobacterium sp. DG1-102-2 TaxID=3081663 RepID=UPI0029499D21|nr:lipocalin family protein [Flavobacterium sp. DG1-102-2]MDV6167889.1 lipocalin family protein [Flavobacterium sp. DG1-102-2]
MKKLFIAGMAAMLFVNCTGDDSSDVLTVEQKIIGKWNYISVIDDNGQELPLQGCALGQYMKFSKNKSKGLDWTSYGTDQNGDCVIEVYTSDYSIENNVLTYAAANLKDTLTFINNNTLKLDNEFTNGVILRRE